MKTKNRCVEYTSTFSQSTVYFIFGSVRYLRSRLKKELGLVDVNIPKAVGLTYSIRAKDGSMVSVIWMQEYDEATLVHECVHAAANIMGERSMPLSTITEEGMNTETLAYMVEELFTEGRKTIMSGVPKCSKVFRNE